MKTKSDLTKLFKSFQTNIKNKSAFDVAKADLFALREAILEIFTYFFHTCTADDFSAMPLKTDKTIAYYIFHMMRIEDIVSNILIAEQPQIFTAQDFMQELNSPITTTGNELTRDALQPFSRQLNLEQLHTYATCVMRNTRSILNNMTFEASKTKISSERKHAVLAAHVVSTDENAFWLVDYWCKKTYGGLMLMPFSRHLMMHTEGCLRIMKQLQK